MATRRMRNRPRRPRHPTRMKAPEPMHWIVKSLFIATLVAIGIVIVLAGAIAVVPVGDSY
jgi:hypothetical protein